jgi:hypothetical protein
MRDPFLFLFFIVVIIVTSNRIEKPTPTSCWSDSSCPFYGKSSGPQNVVQVDPYNGRVGAATLLSGWLSLVFL